MSEKKHSSRNLRTWPFLKEVNNAFNFEIAAAIEEKKPIIFASAMCPQQLGGAFDAV